MIIRRVFMALLAFNAMVHYGNAVADSQGFSNCTTNLKAQRENAKYLLVVGTNIEAGRREFAGQKTFVSRTLPHTLFVGRFDSEQELRAMVTKMKRKGVNMKGRLKVVCDGISLRDSVVRRVAKKLSATVTEPTLPAPSGLGPVPSIRRRTPINKPVAREILKPDTGRDVTKKPKKHLDAIGKGGQNNLVNTYRDEDGNSWPASTLPAGWHVEQGLATPNDWRRDEFGALIRISDGKVGEESVPAVILTAPQNQGQGDMQ